MNSIEYFFSFIIPERLNHENIVTQFVINVKRSVKRFYRQKEQKKEFIDGRAKRIAILKA